MEKLNEYNLLDIFSYLDGDSLKKVSLVNKRFNEIIGSNAATMKKLKLSIIPEICSFTKKYTMTKKQLTDFSKLKRKHKNAIFDEVRINRNIISKLKNQFNNLTELEMINTEITETAFKKLFTSLITLEKLILADTMLILHNAKENSHQLIEPIAMPSLKSLFFVNSSWHILMYIGKSNLQILKLHHNLLTEIGEKVIKDFLVQHSSTLFELALRVNINLFKILSSDEVQNSQFCLKRFALTFFDLNRNSEHNVTDVIDFIELQKDTLQHFETESSLPEAIYDCIFSKLQVKSLILPANYLPERLLFYNAIHRNVHLKKLELTNELQNIDIITGLIDLFNKIEELQIESYALDIAERVLQKIVDMSDLKTLKIPFLVTIPEAFIPTLRNLQVNEIIMPRDFENFISNQRNLENLAIKWIDDDLTASIETVSVQLSHLKKISFGAEFTPTIRLIEVLKNNCHKLKVFEMLKNKFEPIKKDVLRAMNESVIHVYEYLSVNAMKIFEECRTMWAIEEDKYAIASLNSDLDSIENDILDMLFDFNDESDLEDYWVDDIDDFDDTDEDVFMFF